MKMMVNPYIFLYFQLCFVVSYSKDVVLVHILFRHGDRTPIEPYPNDPYKNNSLWPADWGELTNDGKMGHYRLGKWLRNRYNNLLPENYHRRDIEVQSTDVDRTLMSAYCNLAGLYEPDGDSNWSSKIKWTPIPVHTVPENLDKILAGKALCPKYNKELEKVKNSPEFHKIDEENKNLYKFLTKVTGSNITNVIDVERIYDTLFIEDLHQFSLPNWTKSVYPEPMRNLSAFTFTIPCYTKELARLKVGPLLGEILRHMEEKVSNKLKLEKKAWMYSAHDTTVANVLKALDLFEPHCPPYYSLILFELRKVNEDYFVTINYRNSSSAPPYIMQLKGCDKLCPFEKFKVIVSPLIPKDWEAECRTITFIGNIYDSSASISFFTMIFLAVLFIFTLAIVMRLYKNQRWHQSEIAYRSLKLELAS